MPPVSCGTPRILERERQVADDDDEEESFLAELFD
jgi:hypothetical protein